MRNEKIITFASRPNFKMSKGQQRLLAVLQVEENRSKSVEEVCKLAGYASRTPWTHAMKDERFVGMIEALRVPPRQQPRETHLEVRLATNIEEELAKDVWDMRRLKADYPKHRPPAAYAVDFSWIVNPMLREQVKRYLRSQLPRWKANTFTQAIYHLKPLLTLLPPEVHMGTLERSHIEALFLKWDD